MEPKGESSLVKMGLSITDLFIHLFTGRGETWGGMLWKRYKTNQTHLCCDTERKLGGATFRKIVTTSSSEPFAQNYNVFLTSLRADFLLCKVTKTQNKLLHAIILQHLMFGWGCYTYKVS